MVTLTEAITDNPAAVAVLQKHKLLLPDGQWRVTDVEFEGIGRGPLLDPAVIEKFASLDTTRSLKCLDWMLYEAGGGLRAREQSDLALQGAKIYWIEQRMAGFGEASAQITPMARPEAEAAWAAVEPLFVDTIFPADQDMLEYYLERHQLRIFGYTRRWPGLSRIYEKVYKEVKTFLENTTGRVGRQSKLSQINQARQRRAADTATAEADRVYKPVEVNLTKYGSLADLEAVNGEFFRFYKRQKALKDIQFIGREAEPGGQLVYKKGQDVKLYDDANIAVYIPATAAAMMQVGFDNWCVANRTEFERAFRHTNPQEPNWTEYHRNRGPLAVIVLKHRVVEPDRPEGHFYYLSLKKIAVHVRTGICELPALAEPYAGVQFFDRENRNYPKPMEWPELLERLRKVQGVEPDALISSIRTAMQEIIAWARQMKKGDIKISVYECMAALLAYELINS